MEQHSEVREGSRGRERQEGGMALVHPWSVGFRKMQDRTLQAGSPDGP